MMIDRRDFIASATLVCVAPAIQLLPPQHPSSAASQSGVLFMIRGWSVQDTRAGANQAPKPPMVPSPGNRHLSLRNPAGLSIQPQSGHRQGELRAACEGNDRNYVRESACSS